MLAWKRGDLLAAAQRLMAAAGIALAVMVLIYAFTVGGPVLAPVGIGIGAWLILGAISEITFRSKLFTVPLNTALRRAATTIRASPIAAVPPAARGGMVTVSRAFRSIWMGPASRTFFVRVH